MTRPRYFLLFTALLLIALSWWGVVSARTGLVMHSAVAKATLDSRSHTETLTPQSFP